MTGLSKMTLDEAVEHCNDVISELIKKGGCEQCITEHAQLATWLQELKELREFKARVMQAVNKI